MTSVDVWSLRLGPDARAERDAWSVLTPDEQRTADRYRDPADRAARIRTRALLRTVLGRALDRDPRVVEIIATADGKPVLADPAVPRFSVSHSRALAVVAVVATGATELGIDIEPRRDFAWAEVAERFFAPAERAAIDGLAAGERLDAFLAIWVRKEAYLKGLGLGFTDVSDDFEVPLGDGFVHDPARPSTRWYLHGLDLDIDHAAALAVADAPATVVVHEV
ncbi:MAG TPA: 4'-phosphopantetheinyl transferase superfamily protein [Acidimicrobiia bacterium]|jgi:4'-phosphopantetheinyl transferase|nr:4'-phosphopantetheinyl transferase superfamily protein [Acidimicrobiia bacterium]